MNNIRRRVIGLPWFICAVLDIVPRSIEWSDHTLHNFFYRIGSGGVDYLRIFPIWEDGLLPCRKQPGGKWSWKVWNLDYFRALKRVCEAAYAWKIGIYFDLFDHCGTKGDNKLWNPWYNNEQGIEGIYETSDKAIKYYKRWIRKTWGVVGKQGYFTGKNGVKRKLRPNLFGLGNELDSRGTWGGSNQYHQWGYKWGYGLAEYLWRLGYRKEILWSAEEKTGHVLRGYLDKSDPWVKRYVPDCPFGKKDTVMQYHGWINRLTEGVEEVVTTTHIRKIAYSDDGVNYKWGGDGICVEQDGVKKYCSADTSTVIRLCRYIHEHLPHLYQFHHIEQLPRSVSEVGQSLDDLNQHRDVNIYRRIAKRVWGVDITRQYPQWLKDRHGIKE